MSQKIQKVILAYSGGLDTSVILRWLLNEYGCEEKPYRFDRNFLHISFEGGVQEDPYPGLGGRASQGWSCEQDIGTPRL